jgi:carbamoyltransferase
VKLLGIFYFPNYADPSAAIVEDGDVVAFVEEERLVRNKHASSYFPAGAVKWVLHAAGLGLRDLDGITIGWDCGMHADGRLAAHFDWINQSYPPTAFDVAYQQKRLSSFTPQRYGSMITRNLRRLFGDGGMPPLIYVPHHLAHAVMAYYHSGFGDSLVLVVDGSGEAATCTWWAARQGKLELLHEVRTPHSLGWFYSAFTEFLGFDAYDGEYKVMGLAAYGRPNQRFRAALEQMVPVAADGWTYHVDPKYIHHGPHTFSGRFTDHLVSLIGMQPRQGPIPLTAIHEDLAFEAQRLLEDRVLRLVRHFRETTGRRNLCLAGGVALNVKMNSHIRRSGLFDEIFVFPIPSDSGTAIGAAAGVYHELTGRRAKPIEHLYFGPEYSDEEIELQISSCGLSYRVCDDIAAATADLLVQGKVVGWFQGRMEGGPRALGGRSILADPRSIESRDRVNAAIKFREYWRPFCPSLLEEKAHRFVRNAAPAPFMITAFDATEEASELCPAIVHVDQTMRVQTVNGHGHPRFHQLLEAFEKRTGVPVLLNTSFNIKGEAIVCSPRDALRTFCSTGLDALAIGRCLVEKPHKPTFLAPEDVIR